MKLRMIKGGGLTQQASILGITGGLEALGRKVLLSQRVRPDQGSPSRTSRGLCAVTGRVFNHCRAPAPCSDRNYPRAAGMLGARAAQPRALHPDTVPGSGQWPPLIVSFISCQGEAKI